VQYHCTGREEGGETGLSAYNPVHIESLPHLGAAKHWQGYTLKALMSWLISWFSGFLPKQTTVSHRERLRACCGALLGILLTGLISRWAGT